MSHDDLEQKSFSLSNLKLKKKMFLSEKKIFSFEKIVFARETKKRMSTFGNEPEK